VSIPCYHFDNQNNNGYQKQENRKAVDEVHLPEKVAVG